MGFDRINQAVAALQEAGLRVRRGYPAGEMPCITGTAAAVNVGAISPEQTKLTIQVFSGVDGPACEDAAAVAFDALSAIGAVCTVEGCRWESRAGVFFCTVAAVWQERAVCGVKVAGTELPYVVGVTVKQQISRVQVTDPVTGETAEECRDLGWSITIEELLPENYLPEKEGKDAFTVYLYRQGGTERYEKCQWVQVLLENVAGGIRRTRVARTWDGRSLFTE